MRKKSVWLASVCVLGMTALCTAEARAQGAEPGQPVSSGKGGPGIPEIIVTANRRSENVQKIAGTVNVLTGADLAAKGVANIVDLAGQAPGVHIQTMAASNFIYVRGVGASLQLGDPSVPLNLDGVYVGKGTATSGLFFDLARVEVLKGPQSTLYGRNATAGAINLVSNAPSDRLEEAAMFGFGNFQRVTTEAMLNVPLADGIAMRGAVHYAHDDGYLSNGGNQLSDVAGRLQLRVAKGPLTVRVIGDIYNKGGNGPSTVSLYSTDAGCSAGARFCHPDNPWYTNENRGSISVRNWGVASIIDYDVGPATIEVTPAHRESRSNFDAWTNGAFAASTFDVNTRQNSVEARLTSHDSGRFKWILGAYYYSENSTFYQVIRQIGAGPGLVQDAYTNLPTSSAESYAGFAEATATLATGLRLTGGLRYTDETHLENGTGYSIFTASVPGGPPLGVPVSIYPITGRTHSSKLTWKAGVEYDMATHSLLYANVSTGFKSGGLNREASVTASGAPYDNSYAPETITAFAIGAKNRFLDNRLTFNTEAFLWNYNGRQNDQVRALNSPPANTSVDVATANLGKSRIYGIEGTMILALTRNDQFQANATWLRAKTLNDPANFLTATTFPFPPFFLLEPGVDLRNRVMAFSPTWSGSVSYEHIFQLADGSSVSARGASEFQTSSYTQYRLTAQSLQPGYTRSSFTLTYSTPGSHVSIAAFVRNIENRAVIRATSVSGIATATPRYYGYVDEPRTYGFEIRTRF